MARRRLFEGHIWLDTDGLEVEGNRIHPQDEDSLGFAGACSELTRHFKLVLTFERSSEGEFIVRCYPRRGEGQSPVRVASLYIGERLGSIPDAALRDYRFLEEFPHLGQYSPVACPRRVL